MNRLPTLLLLAALAAPVGAQAETITILKPPAQPPVQTVGVKPAITFSVPLVHVPQFDDAPSEAPGGGDGDDAPSQDPCCWDEPSSSDDDDNPLAP